MKKMIVLVFGLLLFGTICSGQTNLASAQCLSFVLPPIHLWEPSPQDQATKLALAVPVSTQLTDSNHVDLNTDTDDNELHSRLLRSGQFYLTPPEPKAENAFVRAAESIWAPEVVKVGKTSISSPIITAIKRKNPLCLLNPIFFQASW